MKLFHSIRTKLTLWYTALLAVTLVGFGAVSYELTRSTLSSSLDQSLRSEVKWVSEFVEPEAKKVPLKRSALIELQELKRTNPVPADSEQTSIDSTTTDELWNQIYEHTILSPRRHYIQILDRNGDMLYHSPSLGGHVLKYDDIPYGWINVVTLRDQFQQQLRLAITQNDYVKIFVAYPLQELNEALDGIFLIFGILAPVALLISLIGGLFLANASLKPVDDITRTARKITAQNLSQRLPTQNVDDEIGRLTETFNDMIQRLQESFVQIQHFSADASHELRTPLTIMRGEIDVALRGKRIPPPTRKLLESVHDELVRLSSIVESLMTLIKSESGRLTFQFHDVALDAMLMELAEDIHLLAARKKIKLQIGEMDESTVRGDAARLRQLFLNLLENAVKYTPTRGTIKLSLRSNDGKAEATIQDTGIGIPRKDLARIFDRFYRVKPGGTGSGLGLSIAKWIAEAHNGTIEVSSREKKGSTFVIKLPLSHTPENSPRFLASIKQKVS